MSKELTDKAYEEIVRAAGVALADDLCHTRFLGPTPNESRPGPNTERIIRRALEAAEVPSLTSRLREAEKRAEEAERRCNHDSREFQLDLNEAADKLAATTERAERAEERAAMHERERMRITRYADDIHRKHTASMLETTAATERAERAEEALRKIAKYECRGCGDGNCEHDIARRALEGETENE